MANSNGRAFHARLEQTEARIWRASYRGDLNADQASADVLRAGPHVYPDTHIGTDPEAVRSFVETLAVQHGYDRVIWEQPEGA